VRLYGGAVFLEILYGLVAKLAFIEFPQPGAVMQAIRSVQFSPLPAQASCILQLTVEADMVTALRHLVMDFCGEALAFMRIALAAPGASTRQARVWLCINASMVAPVMDLIVHTLPKAQFGRIASVRPV
jgi:hypothetical protein